MEGVEEEALHAGEEGGLGEGGFGSKPEDLAVLLELGPELGGRFGVGRVELSEESVTGFERGVGGEGVLGVVD